MKTDTAHQAWNERWQTEAGRTGWLEADPGVTEAASLARRQGAATALDIGAGVGRHSRLLASLGFSVSATDLSEAGLAEIGRMAAAEGLAIETKLAPMTELPFADASFDYVLAFNVIYHGDGPIVEKAISEIERVLRPGGIYQGTMLSKRNSNVGIGTEIAPNTWVREAEDDKVHPHFYCSAAELVHMFGAFELLSLEDREHDEPGSWHWHMVAEKR